MKIKDVARVIGGATPSTKHPEYYDGGIVWATPKDLSDQGRKFFYSGGRTISDLGLRSCAAEIIPADNILMSSRAPIGLIAINKVDCCTNQGFKSLVLDRNLCDVDYMYYYMKYHIKEIEALGSGTTFKEISKSVFEQWDVVLPSLEKQKKIGSALAVIDEKIEINRLISDNLGKLVATIYNYWFVQFDFPNENGMPYKSSGGKMVWNEELKRNIPEGWCVGNLYQIADFVNGLPCQKFRPLDSDNQLPVVKIKEMHNGITPDTEYVRGDIPDKNIINNGDLIFSWSASLEVMVWNGGKAGLNQHIFKVIPKNGFSIHYVYEQISSYIVNFQAMAEARKTTMGHITADHLDQSRIVLPPPKLLREFESKVDTFFIGATKAAEENKHLESLRDFLLPLLMNGQVAFK